MKIEKKLSKKQKQQLKESGKEEELSLKEWQEIMGMYMDTYVRKNGALRRK